MLTAAPASAAPAGLTVTAPEQGSTVDSRTVTVTGSVFGGSTVIAYDLDGDVLARTNPGGTFGQPTNYSLTLPVYAEDAAVQQSIRVGGLYGGSGIPQISVDFNLPVAYNFTVTSPVQGEVRDSRTVTFTGTGTNGSTVNVLGADGNRVPGTSAAVVSNGTWTTTGTYSDDAAVSQTVTANQTTGGAGRGSQTVSFSLPAVAPVGNFTVTSPEEGETVASRTVTFTGTGTNGSTVNVLDTDGNRLPGTAAAVVSNGTWSVTATYADDAAIDQTVSINQVTGGAGRGEGTVNFKLPASTLLPAPVITSPTEGQQVVGSQVTFEGTGIPGAYIGLVVVNTAAFEAAQSSDSMSAAAEPTPADPAADIIVGADGRWSVTLALVPENYTAIAIQSTVANPTDLDQISAPSEPVSFSLVAAGAITPAGNNGTGSSLASTGVETAGVIGFGALMLLGGAALVLARKRRAQIG